MRRHGVVVAVLLVLASGLAAGCGSQLDPADVLRADGTRAVGPTGLTDPAGPVAEVGGPLGSADGATVPAGEADTSEPISDGAPGGGSDGGSDGTSLPVTTTPGDKADQGEPPTGTTPKGACEGLENGNGISDKVITIGNAADVSGPQPGIFAASQDATRAYVAYFNATSDLCGRKLELVSYDTRTDGVAEQEAYVKGCQEVFAMVGSMSAFDASGAGTAADCGLPDIRTAGITPQRIGCRTCFGALSSNPGEFQNAIPDFVLKNYGDAGKHAAMLYIDIGAAPDNAKAQVRIFEKRGMHFDVVQAISIADFNYTPYVQQMKNAGIESVQMIGSDGTAVRLAKAMEQQGFKPKIFLNDPSVYKKSFAVAGGSSVEGTVVFTSVVPFEEADRNAEMGLYLAWLEQVKPGAEPTFFGAYAWSAARLFVEQAARLGGRLDRASLVSALSRVDDWTANGLHAPQRVGAKRVGECNRFIALRDGRWSPVGGTKYTCTGTTLG